MKDLYYILMKNGLGNVKECKTLIKHGLINVNGCIEKNIKRKIAEDDVIMYLDTVIDSQPFYYYMLNKPKGYLCANKDNKERCVMELIDRNDGYCLGRLDRDTTGLLIITNDKSLKKLLLPQNHISKTYLVTTQNSIKESDIESFKQGIVIDNDYTCLPAKLEIINDNQAYLTIQEGKYHQIKKMFLSLDNKVIELKRISFKNIKLDENLEEGKYRKLTREEINDFI